MIKKIAIEQLKPGMYIHDINCGWMDHPFMHNHFAVKDDAMVRQLADIGMHDVYIDTNKGLDVVEAQTEEEVSHEIDAQIQHIAKEKSHQQQV